MQLNCVSSITKDKKPLLAKLAHVARWPSQKSKEWVEKFVLTACEDASTVAVVLLGSIARPVDKPQDVDMLYIFEEKRIELAGRPLDVDLRIYPVKDVTEMIAGGHDLLGWSIKFGHLLYEKHRYWTRLREHWLPRLPFPSVQVALERARKAGELYKDLRGMGDLDAAHEAKVCQLTHLARARLLFHKVYPASRPELPNQLLGISEQKLAQLLSDALREELGAAMRPMEGLSR